MRRRRSGRLIRAFQEFVLEIEGMGIHEHMRMEFGEKGVSQVCFHLVALPAAFMRRRLARLFKYQRPFELGTQGFEGKQRRASIRSRFSGHSF